MGNLKVDRTIEDSVSAANHGFVSPGRIPGKGNPWSKVVFVGGQGGELSVKLISQGIVEREIGPNGPSVLPVCGRQGPREPTVVSLAETLLVDLRQPQGGGLQSVQGNRTQRSRQATTRIGCGYGRAGGIPQAWAQQSAGKGTEHKPSWKENM